MLDKAQNWQYLHSWKAFENVEGVIMPACKEVDNVVVTKKKDQKKTNKHVNP